jgi:cell division protein ZapA
MEQKLVAADEIKTHEVQIAGLPLKLRSSHSAQTVSELIALVNDREEKAMKLNPNLSFQKALVLASLHIAEDLLLLKRTTHGELDQLERQAKRILSELESSPVARIRMDN